MGICWRGFPDEGEGLPDGGHGSPDEGDGSPDEGSKVNRIVGTVTYIDQHILRMDA